MPTIHADALLRAFASVGWVARDSGRTVSTDEGEGSLTTLLLDVGPVRDARNVAEVESAAPGALPATLRGAVFAAGDLHVGEGVEIETNLVVVGNLVLRRNAMVRGFVHATGDVTLEHGASIGDLEAGGLLSAARAARLSGAVIAPATDAEPSVFVADPAA
ncbi:MAG: bactofilin family protein [Thermoplasmatota archaeon]